MRIYKHKAKKDGIVRESPRWYADVRLPGKRRASLPLFTDERLSQKFADDLEVLVGQYESGRGYTRDMQRWLDQQNPRMVKRLAAMGLVEGTQVAAGADLTDHITDYKAYLVHKGDTAEYAEKSAGRITAIVKACRFKTLMDVQPSRIQKYLSDEMQAGRIGQRTANHYIRAIKTFFTWMVQDGRCVNSPVQFLKMLTVTNIKKVRRSLTVAEVGYLLDWLAGQDNISYGLTAQQRRLVYLLSLTTGLRAAEIGALTSSSIDYKDKRVIVPSCYTKNRQDANLPLRADVVDALRSYTSRMVPGTKLFDMPHRTADMLRDDMTGARTVYLSEGGQDDSFLTTDEVDFHALRHSFGSYLASSGVSPKVAQTLMRHSTITLTMDRYSHVFRGDDAEAVDSLPAFNNQAKKGKKKA